MPFDCESDFYPEMLTQENVFALSQRVGLLEQELAEEKASKSAHSAAIEELVKAAETDIQCCDYCLELGSTCQVHQRTEAAISAYKKVSQ